MSGSVYELDSFIDWLEKQPAEDTYIYTSNRHCLCAQYLREKGLPVYDVDHMFWYERDNTSHFLPVGFNAIAKEAPWTFGDALARAREIKANQLT